MRSFIAASVFALASSPSFAAQQSITVAHSTDGNRYFIVFSARGDGAAGSSVFGHAFVAWGREDHDTKQSTYIAYGLYPKDRSVKGQVKSVFWRVPGEIVNEALDANHSVSKTTGSLIVEVGRGTYDDTLSNTFGLREQSNFKLAKEDCVSLVRSVAMLVFGDIPPRSFMNLTPQNYVRSMMTYYLRPQVIKTPNAAYTGPVVWFYATGNGEVKWKNGASFKGEFLHGMPYRGTLFFPSGEATKLTRDGSGQEELSFPGGTRALVTAKGDEITHISYSYSDGRTGEVDLKTGSPSTGTIKYPDGTIENVTWSDGKKTIKFKKLFKDGDVFDGTIGDDGSMTGTYFWKAGEKQTGTLIDGKFEGHTTFWDKAGDRYEGNWSDGHAEGAGVEFRPDGSQLIGTWHDGDLQTDHAKVRDPGGNTRDFAMGGRGGGSGGGDDGGRMTEFDKEGHEIGSHDLGGMDIGVGRGGHEE
jgi:hypothetical protein